MDAAEDDQDVKLQRASADLLADFQSSIEPFLWKQTKSGKKYIRHRVRVRDTDRLVNLLEPFQELPQLLDPHLDKFVPVLANALLASLQAPTPKDAATNTQLLIPLSKAICKLLYTFCKIRGDKVIVRFWSTEIRYLELLLTAIESNNPADGAPTAENPLSWDWEERYIALLWLSQLLLAPFDLDSISSGDTEDVSIPDILGLLWPADTPAITLRAVSLGVRYLSSSGKERDAAKVLLMRTAMRRDMQALGIQDALMQWAISHLQLATDSNRSTYHYIGVLSFLAAMLNSSVGTRNMDPYIRQVFQVIESIASDESNVFKVIRESAVARKTVIKILRTISVLLLQDLSFQSNIIEFTISYMLDSLADTATPVRLAASKALSIIALKLPLDMATQVVEEVLEVFNKNVLWTELSTGVRVKNISRVNPLEWHGLTLTLSHLLYRQSVPARDLLPVLSTLRLALCFEQRSTAGSSIGTNVRDAACFGIWAVARRYRTAELQILRLEPGVITHLPGDKSEVSALQTLANDLVVSACVDPAGNIRRGSSAALQELIGRHPDMIFKGILVVQVVDYHAVALRARAMREVAVQASQLSEDYHEAILRGLLGWRGVGDASPITRKVAASTVGDLVWQRHMIQSLGWKYIQGAIDNIAVQIRALESRELNERHGLILAFSATITSMHSELTAEKLHAELHRIQKKARQEVSEAKRSINDTRAYEFMCMGGKESDLYNTLRKVNTHMLELLADFKKRIQSSRHQELLAEAFYGLTVATYRIPGILGIFKTYTNLRSQTHPTVSMGKQMLTIDPETGDVAGCTTQCWIRQLMLTQMDLKSDPYKYILDTEAELIAAFMKSATVNNFATLSEAINRFVGLESILLQQTTRSSLMVGQWIIDAISTRGKRNLSYLHVLVNLFPILQSVRDPAQLQKVTVTVFQDAAGASTSSLDEDQDWRPAVMHAILERWRRDPDVDTRSTILQCLACSTAPEGFSTMLESHTASCTDMIQEGLQDFTTNARGDVGSLVRIAAAEAATIVLSMPIYHEAREAVGEKLVGGILRIAAEKLDKVRVEGQRAVAKLNDQTSSLASLAPSSQEYFFRLLGLKLEEWWTKSPQSTHWATSLLEGYITSADTGSEDLVRVSRAALVEYCNNGNGDFICHMLFELAKSQVDRVLIPALEVMGFLFDMQIMQKSSLNWNIFYAAIQGAHYKSNNVRKLEAAIKIYGGLIEVHPQALTKLSSLLLHNYPKIRNAAADELWVAKGVGKGVDWVGAKKEDLERVRKEIREVA